jgi:hypothetical protein
MTSDSNAHHHYDTSAMLERIATLESEVETYRAALEKIADYHSHVPELEMVFDIAREALT